MSGIKSRYRGLILAAVVLGLFFSPLRATEGTQVKSPLDRAVIHVPSISRERPIRIRRFLTDNADLGTGANKNKPKYVKIAEEMKEYAPKLLLKGLVDQLTAQGFADVAPFEADGAFPEGTIVIQGEFTVLNPGSQGKRYVVGFGAGKSKTCVSGQVVDASLAVLAEFDHCRNQALGLFGGDSEAQIMKDSMKSGDRMARFMAAWADGQYAK